MNWNQRLRKISSPLRLSHAEIARACAAGGMPDVSASRVRAWLANQSSTKTGVRGQTLSKYRPMTEDEFDAFLSGLRPLLDLLDAIDEGDS